MEALYFIAVVPPKDIRKEVKQIKEHFASEYGSKHALKSPAHITLHMPFKWKEKKLPMLLEALDESIDSINRFKIRLENFDCFSPRVIFIDVEENADLANLQKSVKKSLRKINLLNADYKERPFHPHMTVAFRDLRKAEFNRAWNEFEDKEFKAEFAVSSISLLKHDGKVWQIDRDFQIF